MNDQHSGESIPNNAVIAVIGGARFEAGVVQDLERGGFQHGVLFRGNEIADKVDPKGEHGSLISKVLKGVQEHLSEQPNYLAQYQEEARNGNTVVAVHVKDREKADEVRQILERNGAQNIRFFSKLAVVDLTPESNPSHRSAHSAEIQAKN